MSSNPPPPPEVPQPNNPPLRPDDGDAQRDAQSRFMRPPADDDYVEIEIPLDDYDDYIAAPNKPTEQTGCKGCVWGLGGALGCMSLLVVVLFAGLLLVGKEVTTFVGDVANFFEVDLPRVDWNERAEVEVPPNVYVPSVEPIQALAEVVTTRYNFSQIVTGQSDMPSLLAPLYGDELVMVAVGHIEAGFNVDNISNENITFDETTNTLTLTLPAPVLRACFLNENDSYIAQRRTGTFAQPVPNLEQTTRSYALRQFRQQALDDGILEEAVLEAQRIMTAFVQRLVPEGVQVEIFVETPASNAPLPETCR